MHKLFFFSRQPLSFCTNTTAVASLMQMRNTRLLYWRRCLYNFPSDLVVFFVLDFKPQIYIENSIFSSYMQHMKDAFELKYLNSTKTGVKLCLKFRYNWKQCILIGSYLFPTFICSYQRNYNDSHFVFFCVDLFYYLL